MKGQLDPKTRKPFTNDQKQSIKSVQSHNLLHNSEVDRSTLNHLSLPPNRSSIDECNLKEVKQILYQRGGSATGRDGKALNSGMAKKYATAYLQLERLNCLFKFSSNQQLLILMATLLASAFVS